MTAVKYGRMYYKHIEHDKTVAIKKAAGNFDSACHLSHEAREEIFWWKDNISNSFAYIKDTPKVDLTIYMDASDEGWGASDGNNPI